MAKARNKKEELGAGIQALLGSISDELEDKQVLNTIIDIPVDQIEENPYQPRIDFDEEKLKELSESIEVHGLVQPITVRWMGNNRYQLIAGERRLRASKMAGLLQIPAYIRTANDQTLLEMALIENIQREDLNPLEVALSYQRLIDECNLVHDALAKRVGKDRTTITNYLRLLKLPPEIQHGLKTRQISMGHARALVNAGSIEHQLNLYRLILEKGLSVRQVESLVSGAGNPVTKPVMAPSGLPIHVRKIQEDLQSHFGTKISIKRNSKGKGQLVIPFSSDKDLNRILELINR
ncbi:ParB/RepB/Spo0J family partition protein [Sphingobacteriales bacterium UPWRP_1]|nr:chromosome partitioning protein ParB [Sphingobacteriales bacterium TSM_CSS]PSJ74835.1 ParB/RepB/Spo0J family partition protein [Sphingobacteriales bacterium UPWRP_1]